MHWEERIGLINKTAASKELTIIENEKEIIKLAWNSVTIDKIADGIDINVSDIENEIKKFNSDVNVKTENDKFIINFNNTKHTYTIDKEGSISQITNNKIIPVVEEINFLAGSYLEELGYEVYCTDSSTYNDFNELFKSWDGYILGGAWSNGYAYLQSLEQYDFSEIDKVEVGVVYGANSKSCINTFTVGLTSNNENNNKFDENLKVSEENTNLSNCREKDFTEKDIRIVSLDTKEINGKYFLKLCEDHGATPSTMTTEARVYWIKIYYNENKKENGIAKKFKYTGNYQEYEIPKTGYYKIECYGAKGGSSMANGSTGASGGNGGYTSGIIKLNEGEKIYIYVGGHGSDAIVGKDVTGGYNGGGIGTWDHNDDEAAGAGGGATDIRLVAGEWNDFESLKSRIMVAAGGGGSAWHTGGGAGGGLIGLTNREKSIPGSQTSGYKFGIGQDGYGIGDSDGVAGSGGGYYGGTTSDYSDGIEAGAGGSSFISGYDGCDAIDKNSTESNISHTNQNVHYSGKKFIDTICLDGNSSQKPISKNKNGYVIITFQGTNI